MRCDIEYLGAAYAGYQRQPEVVSVQEMMELAVAAVTQERVTVVASGRTDAGANACGQVVAFDTSSRLSADTLLRALNANLPRDIAVTNVAEVPLDFHPRFDAASREYQYRIWNRPVRSPFWEGRGAHVPHRLNEGTMHQALQYLVGRHDFSAFAPASYEGNRVRTITRATCTRAGDVVTITLEGNGFMRQMVRTIVGTAIEIGMGKLVPVTMQDILQSGDRTQAGSTAPACGLYLAHVRYPETTLELAAHGR